MLERDEGGTIFALHPTLYLSAENLEAADRQLTRILDTLPQVVCFGWSSSEANGEDGASVREILSDQMNGTP